MKYCQNCQAQYPDEVNNCTRCGQPVTFIPNSQPNTQPNGQPNPQSNVQSNYQPYPQSFIDPYDHTSEFSAEEVSKNKLFAILVYLFSLLGILFAILADKDSDYLKFHIRQSLKLVILESILGICSAVLSWTCIVPIAGAICLIILLVVQIIGFFWTCSGKSKELPIIRNFNFLK